MLAHLFDDKKSFVGQVFSSVASKYDIMNDLMSLGLHRIWKDKMLEYLYPLPHQKIIDVAFGTGDISSRIVQKMQKNNISDYELVMSDINIDMLQTGKNKFLDKNIVGDNLSYICADGENLPFKSDYFDYYTIAYGIRNFSNIDKGLLEAYRLLKSGGKFICLEFSKVENKQIEKFYDLYSFAVIPKIGKIVTQDENSYKYLVESIRKFPERKIFMDMMQNAGFNNVEYRDLNFGITTIYIGEKL